MRGESPSNSELLPRTFAPVVACSSRIASQLVAVPAAGAVMLLRFCWCKYVYVLRARPGVHTTGRESTNACSPVAINKNMDCRLLKTTRPTDSKPQSHSVWTWVIHSVPRKHGIFQNGQPQPVDPCAVAVNLVSLCLSKHTSCTVIKHSEIL